MSPLLLLLFILIFLYLKCVFLIARQYCLSKDDSSSYLQQEHYAIFDEMQQEKATQREAVIYMYCFADFTSAKPFRFVCLYQTYIRCS